MIARLRALLRRGPSRATRARIADLADAVQPTDPRPAALSAELVAARLDRVTRPWPGSTTFRSWPGHVLSLDRASDCPECEALRQAMLRPPSGP